MIFLIIAFFYGSMIIASEENQQDQRTKILYNAFCVIIDNEYKPSEHSHMKSVEDVKQKIMHINGGVLPISQQAKKQIVLLLAAEFAYEPEARNFFKKYAQEQKLHELSIEKTLILLSGEYDQPYNPKAFFVSLFTHKKS